jgi:two-component system response regulator
MQGSLAEVLLIEDAVDDAELLTRALVKWRPDTRVTVVHDGIEALRWLHDDGRDEVTMPNLIVLDLHLPILDGIQVLRCLRADSRTAGIPVIVFSGTCSPEDVGASRSYGARACMRKPDSAGDMMRFFEFLTSELTVLSG